MNSPRIENRFNATRTKFSAKLLAVGFIVWHRKGTVSEDGADGTGAQWFFPDRPAEGGQFFAARPAGGS